MLYFFLCASEYETEDKLYYLRYDVLLEGRRVWLRPHRTAITRWAWISAIFGSRRPYYLPEASAKYLKIGNQYIYKVHLRRSVCGVSRLVRQRPAFLKRGEGVAASLCLSWNKSCRT